MYGARSNCPTIHCTPLRSKIRTLPAPAPTPSELLGAPTTIRLLLAATDAPKFAFVPAVESVNSAVGNQAPPSKRSGNAAPLRPRFGAPAIPTVPLIASDVPI